MTPKERLDYLDKLSRDVDNSYEVIKPDLYSKTSWWRIVYEKALRDLDNEVKL
jgi:hypothetical protein